MALALLDLAGADIRSVRFRADTGTNPFAQLKVGRAVASRHGMEWVDDVYLTVPLDQRPATGGLLTTSRPVAVPASRFEPGTAYVQLFTFKTKAGRSPAFSTVVRVPGGLRSTRHGAADFITMEVQHAMSVTETSAPETTAAPSDFASPRRVPCRTGQEYVQQASFGDLLTQIVNVAGPIVTKMLAGQGAGQQAAGQQVAGGGAQGSSAAAGAPTPTPPLGDAIAGLLGALLNNFIKLPAAGASAPQSLMSTAAGNRFAGALSTEFVEPFIFGIDDAIIASLVGPIVQVLPQLMNAANQQKLQQKQANNKLITDLVSDVNRRMMMQSALEAQKQNAGLSQTERDGLNQLLQLLQQSPAAGAGATVQPQSLDMSGQPAGPAGAPSKKAVLSFVTGERVEWNGKQQTVFDKAQLRSLRIRMEVAEPVPKRPLPKAIVKLTFKDLMDHAVLFERTFKLRDVVPRTVLPLEFAAGELAHLPVNRPLEVVAELRWQGSRPGAVYSALGSLEAVLVNKYFVRHQGAALNGEQELKNMQRFRPFWNKVWEAPVLDAVTNGNRSERKLRWELDATVKYTVLFSPEHDANGTMETKVLAAAQDGDSVVARTAGRIKSGLEISVSELNKALTLWNGESSLPAEQLEAFKTNAFARDHATELTHHVKMKGRAGERGMLWIVPVLKLFEFTVGAVQKSDETGQVTAATDQKLRFPIPVSARVVGVRSAT